MDDDNPIWGIVIVLVLLILNAVISSAKAALASVNEVNVRRKAEGQDKRAGILLKLLEVSGRYRSILEFLQRMSGIVTGILFYSNIYSAFKVFLLDRSLKIDSEVLIRVSFVLMTLLLILIITIFGTILPGKLAARHAETTAYRLAGFIRFLTFLFKPLGWLIEALLRAFGIKHDELEGNVTEEEFISMVNEGHEQGVFDEGEAEMISNIIEMGDKEAKDIMTHKKRIIAISTEMTVEEALQLMLSENYSRYPLYEDNRDNIIGILYLKDVINTYISCDHKGNTLKDIAREPYFIPDTLKINNLFKDMKSKNIHVVIAIDEYGQTAGLVTMEDILEEIVGNIQDEYDEDENLILIKETDSCIVKGSISLEDLEEELDINIDHEDFDTINGLLISLLDRIPGDGEKAVLEYQGYRFDILETRNKMISQVRITRLPKDVPVATEG